MSAPQVVQLCDKCGNETSYRVTHHHLLDGTPIMWCCSCSDKWFDDAEDSDMPQAAAMSTGSRIMQEYEYVRATEGQERASSEMIQVIEGLQEIIRAQKAFNVFLKDSLKVVKRGLEVILDQPQGIPECI